MTTSYRQLSHLPVGGRVIFMGDFGVDYDVETGINRLLIPNGSIMEVVANFLLDPSQFVTLRAEDAELQKAILEWSELGTVNIGPDDSGDIGLSQLAPVDIIS